MGAVIVAVSARRYGGNGAKYIGFGVEWYGMEGEIVLSRIRLEAQHCSVLQ